MYAIQNRQYLSVIATTGADIHCAVTYRDSGLGRGHTRTKLTAITAASATPGTAILGAATASAGGVDSAQASFEVTNISIRNIDTTSQTVTVCIVEVDDAGTQTVYQLYKETIATAQELVFEENAGWSLATHNTVGIWNTLIAPANVVNQTADVLADVSGLTFPVVSGQVYEFKAELPYTSGASTTGVRFVVNGPAVTFLNGRSKYPLGTATTFTETTFSAVQIPAAANADTMAAGGIGSIAGFIKPSADGTFAIQVASENNTQPITVLAGATLMIRRVL